MTHPPKDSWERLGMDLAKIGHRPCAKGNTVYCNDFIPEEIMERAIQLSKPRPAEKKREKP